MEENKKTDIVVEAEVKTEASKEETTTKTPSKFKKFLKLSFIVSTGILIGMLLSLFTAHMVEETSDGEFCGSCHTMEPMVKAFEQDIHGGNNRVGFKATCTDCHLPHNNVVNYMFQKSLTGMHDVWVQNFGDLENIDWQEKRKHRKSFVYDSGCLKCHKNLKDATMGNHKAFNGHKAYFSKKDELGLTCVSCHENVGHKNLSDYLKGKK